MRRDRERREQRQQVNMQTLTKAQKERQRQVRRLQKQYGRGRQKWSDKGNNRFWKSSVSHWTTLFVSYNLDNNINNGILYSTLSHLNLSQYFALQGMWSNAFEVWDLLSYSTIKWFTRCGGAMLPIEPGTQGQTPSLYDKCTEFCLSVSSILAFKKVSTRGQNVRPQICVHLINTSRLWNKCPFLPSLFEFCTSGPREGSQRLSPSARRMGGYRRAWLSSS